MESISRREVSSSLLMEILCPALEITVFCACFESSLVPITHLQASLGNMKSQSELQKAALDMMPVVCSKLPVRNARKMVGIVPIFDE